MANYRLCLRKRSLTDQDDSSHHPDHRKVNEVNFKKQECQLRQQEWLLDRAVVHSSGDTRKVENKISLKNSSQFRGHTQVAGDHDLAGILIMPEFLNIWNSYHYSVGILCIKLTQFYSSASYIRRPNRS